MHYLGTSNKQNVFLWVKMLIQGVTCFLGISQVRRFEGLARVKQDPVLKTQFLSCHGVVEHVWHASAAAVNELGSLSICFTKGRAGMAYVLYSLAPL